MPFGWTGIDKTAPSKDTLLQPTERLTAVLARWAHLTDEGQVNLVQVRRSFFFKLVHLEQAITVNFNTYFRMAQGVSETHFRLYVTPQMSVSDAIAGIFKRLKFKDTEVAKFGLFGAEKSNGACAGFVMTWKWMFCLNFYLYF